MKCPSCGEEIEEGDTFCDNCGKLLENNQNENKSKESTHQVVSKDSQRKVLMTKYDRQGLFCLFIGTILMIFPIQILAILQNEYTQRMLQPYASASGSEPGVSILILAVFVGIGFLAFGGYRLLKSNK